MAKTTPVIKQNFATDQLSAVEQAPNVSRIEIIGILPQLARSFDVVAATIANDAGRHKIVVLAETPAQAKLIEGNILAQMPEAYRKRVLILDRINQSAIFGNNKKAIFKAFGRLEDRDYFEKQLSKLLQGYKVEEEIHPIEIIAQVLGISEHLQTLAQDAHTRWMYEVMA